MLTNGLRRRNIVALRTVKQGVGERKWEMGVGEKRWCGKEKEDGWKAAAVSRESWWIAGWRKCAGVWERREMAEKVLWCEEI